MNPEFQRHLQLEFSLTRLVGMPAILWLIFSLIYAVDTKDYQQEIANAALILYAIIVLFWGAKQASASIFEELNNNTWDLQKTSALSAWSLAWGKLLGSTGYNWYGGILCLIIYSIFTLKPPFIILTLFIFIGGGLLAQNLSLLLSVISLRSQQNINSGISYLLILCLIFFISTIFFQYSDFYFERIRWYNISFNKAYFLGISLILAAIWSLIGTYRLLCEELRIRTFPLAWLSFLSFIIFYLTGLIMNHTPSDYNISFTLILTVISFGILVISAYSALFINENSPMLTRRLWLYAQRQNWARFFQEIPCWMISLTLAAIPTFILTLAYYPIIIEKIGEVIPFPLVIYFLMVRDISVLLFFSYANNPKYSLSLTLLSLMCLYGFFPIIFSNTQLDWLANLILPLLNKNLFIASFIAAIQACIMVFLLFRRWEKLMNEIDY